MQRNPREPLGFVDPFAFFLNVPTVQRSMNSCFLSQFLYLIPYYKDVIHVLSHCCLCVY